MTSLSPQLRRAVARRAGDCCEYCGLSQLGQEASFHVDHIMPRASGGMTVLENLALACVSCSLHKAAKRTAVDPEGGDEVTISNLRSQRWDDHFRWENEIVRGSTSTGRASVDTLRMNRPLILAIRKEESLLGRYPPR